jgi:Protein of unknown function (DUF1173)
LVLWAASDDTHMMIIAIFSVAAAGVPTIAELSLIPVTRPWLPIESGFEKQPVEKLVREERCFVKGLRYSLGAASALACATLTDCEGSASLLFVIHAGTTDSAARPPQANVSGATWYWTPTDNAMPALPLRRARQPVATEFAVECR